MNPGVDAGNGLNVAVKLQLAIAASVAPQDPPEMTNSGFEGLGVPSVIEAKPLLVTVYVCGRDCVPCAVEANVSEAGTTVTSGAVVVPLSVLMNVV